MAFLKDLALKVQSMIGAIFLIRLKSCIYLVSYKNRNANVKSQKLVAKCRRTEKKSLWHMSRVGK